MIESILLTTAQKTVMGQESNSLKNKMKRENSDVSLFQYKVTILFLFPLSVKVVKLARYMINQITRPAY